MQRQGDTRKGAGQDNNGINGIDFMREKKHRNGSTGTMLGKN